MSFKPLSYLENAVQSKDIKDIRIAILSYIKKCLGDTQEINDALNYIKKSLDESEYDAIWENHDGLNLDNDKINWNKSYFSEVEVDLSDNFSRERFDHILQVGRYVYGTTDSLKTTVNTSSRSLNEKKEEEKSFLQIALVGGVILLLGVPLIIKIMKK